MRLCVRPSSLLGRTCPRRDWVLANNPWDTHRNHFPLVKDELLPRADRALAALIEDLHQRGLLGQTLVVWMGDFGRTPHIERRYASRDHWPHANTVLFAGAGVPGGLVHGRTDRNAAEVTEDPVSPADLTATILHLLGVEPRSTVRDPQGRPHATFELWPGSGFLAAGFHRVRGRRALGRPLLRPHARRQAVCHPRCPGRQGPRLGRRHCDDRVHGEALGRRGPEGSTTGQEGAA